MLAEITYFVQKPIFHLFSTFGFRTISHPVTAATAAQSRGGPEWKWEREMDGFPFRKSRKSHLPHSAPSFISEMASPWVDLNSRPLVRYRNCFQWQAVVVCILSRCVVESSLALVACGLLISLSSCFASMALVMAYTQCTHTACVHCNCEGCYGRLIKCKMADDYTF